MSTIQLHDASLSGYIEWQTDLSPEGLWDQINDHTGRWWNGPWNTGAILLSDSWSAWFFLSEPDVVNASPDPYPDFVLNGSDWQDRDDEDFCDRVQEA